MLSLSDQTFALGLISLLLGQRLAELAISNRNARHLISQGASEAGRGHYPVLVLLHAGFIAALIVETLWGRPAVPSWWPLPLTGFLAAQFLRYWCITALGRRWTTRIFVLPGRPLVQRGPYRLLKHPNYLAVMIEFVAVPLLIGAFITMAFFVPLNGLLLYKVRIPAEEAALGRFATGSDRAG